MYIYHIFFIRSSVSEYLGCFYVLVIVSSAALNIANKGPSSQSYGFSSIRVFSKAMALLIRWPQYLSFSFSISSSSEYSGFISFKIDCFDFLAVQGKLKSLVIHDGRKSLCIKNRDGGIKGHVFISCKNTKITTSC